VAATNYGPIGSLRSWNTHSRQTVGGATPLYTVTETPFRPADLSAEEANFLNCRPNATFSGTPVAGKAVARVALLRRSKRIRRSSLTIPAAVGVPEITPVDEFSEGRK
jgi:hypothetical protein